MVLLDDNFSTIVAAVEEGRRIFDNIRKFTNYLLSTSLGEVVVVLALSVAGYFPLSATMLLWVNVVTDLIPASALAGRPGRAACDETPAAASRRADAEQGHLCHDRRKHVPHADRLLADLLGRPPGWAASTYARTMLFTSIVLHAFTRVMVVRQMDTLSIWSNSRAALELCGRGRAATARASTHLWRDLFGIVPLDWRAWAVMVPVVAGSSLAGAST